MHRALGWSLSFTLLIAAGCDTGKGPGTPTSTALAAQAATVHVSGRIADEAGEPQEAFLVLASAAGEVPEVDPDSLFSDAEGRYQLELPPGEYELLALDDQGRTASATLDAQAQALQVDLVLRVDERAAETLFEHGPREQSEEAPR